MTRLTPDDVSALTQRLQQFENGLQELCGLTLRELAIGTAVEGSACVPLIGAQVMAVPVTSGEGVISGFCECVTVILEHLGCEAGVTGRADVRGLQEAVDAGSEVIFIADDFRFVALRLSEGRCVDNDPATADGYVTALEAAAGGLVGRRVLLLGLGPVGRAAARRLVSHGAMVSVVEPDAERLAAALEAGLRIKPVGLADGLAACDLVFDATPAAAFIGAEQVRPGTIAAVPGLPSAFTAEAQAALGVRHIHEPLAIGVAVMAARALA